MLTEKDYCDYETCVALKELGYDGYCAAYYHLYDDEDDARNSFEYAYGFDFQNSNNIYRVGAPLLYQAQKWLREEKGYFVGLIPHDNLWEVAVLDIITGSCLWAKMTALSYEETLSEGLKKAVEILKENKYGKDSNTCQ